MKWGILGCGAISNDFANALNSVTDASIEACGARTEESAAQFGALHGKSKNKINSFEVFNSIQ